MTQRFHTHTEANDWNKYFFGIDTIFEIRSLLLLLLLLLQTRVLANTNLGP